MITRAIVLLASAGLVAGAAEPLPHPLTGAVVKLPPAIGHVSAVHELPDGRLLISDANAPRVSVLAPDGSAKSLGSPGSGEGQYAQPGGYYPAADGSLILIDRAGPRALILTTKLEFTRASSLAEPGVQRSSSVDNDWVRVDAKGRAYFTHPTFMPGATTMDLVRLDPATQHVTPIAQLRVPQTISTSGGNGMTYSRAVIGSPADDWGVASDGRVAVVRASPYRVDWLGVDGQVTKGPEIPFDSLPMTDADKRAFEARNAANAPRAGVAGGDLSSGAALPNRYTDTKAPFVVGDVSVSPAGLVFVLRSAPFGAKTIACDVFDTHGVRTMRIEFPAGSRIVGFGANDVFVRQGDGAAETLTRYRLS